MFANKSFYVLVFICFTICLLTVAEKPDDGCQTSSLVMSNGVLSSTNYPHTYPNNSCYEWMIRINDSRKIVLKFDDLSIEGVDCETDHLKILKESHGIKYVYWKYCGQLMTYPLVTSQPIYTDTSELTVSFRSSYHSSGRGFRLSYSSVNTTDLLNCTSKGIHYSLSNYRKYCPAGCGGATGDVDGDVSKGYRDTSVLCKAAVHAGVILDQFGGLITVQRLHGIRYYEPVRANGLLTRQGSLSESLFTFSTNECSRHIILHPLSISSSWEKDGSIGSQGDFSIKSTLSVSPTGTSPIDSKPWLQFDLGEKRRITGIITRPSDSQGFVKSYKIVYKDKGRWRTYTQFDSTEDMIFEGNTDYLYPARNTFNPSFTARYIRVHPLQWEHEFSLAAELLGCAYIRSPQDLNATTNVLPKTIPNNPTSEGEEIPAHVPSDPTNLVIIVVSVAACGVLLLLLLGVCVFKMLQKKKSKENIYDSSDLPQTGCWKQIKHPSPRHQSTEFTFSYSSEKDHLPKMDLVTSTIADYQQPLMLGVDTVSRKGSTFRPMDMDSKDEAADVASHYDYLHTTNQYALPLTNQEPEYATPIIERHVFRKDGFLPDPSYSVPGAVLTKSSSFNAVDGGNYRKVVGAVSGGYQTPQVIRNGAKLSEGVKPNRLNHSEGVYDSPPCRKPVVLQNGHCSEYQKPQTKSYRTPRDCVRLDPEGCVA